MCHRETERDFHPPWNFSWVVEGELAAMGWPRTPTNVNYIIKENIKHLVTLSPEMLPAVSNRPELSWTLIPVEEFEPPTVDQIAEFIDICIENRQRNRAVGVHCRMGNGRSGVMAACFLVHFKGLSPDRAITDLRLQRPGSVETRGQERAVVRYHDSLRGTPLEEIRKLEEDLKGSRRAN